MLKNNDELEIERHRAAIIRKDLSRPVRLAIESSLLKKENTFFDYGCGHGEDISILAKQEFTTNGWDPHFAPKNSIKPADIVNLGYVLNVIENERERRETLLKSWALANKVLIVAAQVLVGEPSKTHLAYNDGFITTRNTFQKYFEQQELKNYIDSVLGVDAVPVGLGIFFVFRNEEQAEAFRASRFRSQISSSRIKIEPKRFNDYLPILQPLMDFMTERGRLPVIGELSEDNQIKETFKTIKRAFYYIKLATNNEEWESIFEERSNDMLVYLALSRFERRPNFRSLPKEIQFDIKAFFKNYTLACETADELLFSLGKEGEIAKACRKSKIGKFVGNALYVHTSALSELEPILRVYEGAASRTFGSLDEVTIIKFRADKPKISYLYYPDFDSDPHPALHSSMQANLRGLYVNFRDYSTSSNPPILHRKETFISPEYPNYKKFRKLTEAEEKLGLLENSATIGTRNGWQERLAEFNVTVQKHNLILK